MHPRDAKRENIGAKNWRSIAIDIERLSILVQSLTGHQRSPDSAVMVVQRLTDHPGVAVLPGYHATAEGAPALVVTKAQVTAILEQRRPQVYKMLVLAIEQRRTRNAS